MKCPFCESDDNHVVDTRWTETKWVTRRRYLCHVCKKRFTTHEGYNTKTKYDMIKHRAEVHKNDRVHDP